VRTLSRWRENKVKVDLTEIRYDDVGRIGLARDGHL
jgi:hypothetical protein